MDGVIQTGGGLIQPAPVFSGVVKHSLDIKRRLTIPAEWRGLVGTPERVFIMPAFEGEPCLYAYPMRVMTVRLGGVAKSQVSDVNYRLFTRLLGENSAELTWDTQGRIRIPDHLLEKAAVGDEVYMIGAHDRFELWNPETRRAYREEKEKEVTLGQVAKLLGF